MVKTRYAKRKTTVRRKVYRKKAFKVRRTKTISNKIHYFKRFCTTISKSDLFDASTTLTLTGTQFRLTTGAVALNNYYYSTAFTHKLSDVANYAEFTSLFDQYRIVGVKISILPLANSVNTGDASSVMDTTMVIHHCMDFDDGTPYAASLAGVQDMQQRGNYKRAKGWTPTYKYYKPRVLTLGTVAAGGQNVVNPRAPWTNCANADLVHYGSKFIFQIFNSSAIATNMVFDVQMQYYIQLRGQI